MIANDTYRHKGLRKQLALLLKEKGIESTDVLKAIETVPRHLFLNSSFVERAYQDIAFLLEPDKPFRARIQLHFRQNCCS
jgi:protein-L-isoaspartate(D-aspartate) O-methyltransferase